MAQAAQAAQGTAGEQDLRFHKTFLDASGVEAWERRERWKLPSVPWETLSGGSGAQNPGDSMGNIINSLLTRSGEGAGSQCARQRHRHAAMPLSGSQGPAGVGLARVGTTHDAGAVPGPLGWRPRAEVMDWR